MRTLGRQRDPVRDTALTVVVALAAGESIEPGDLVMLEDVGAAMVLTVAESAADGLAPGERAAVLRVEALAYGNTAPDIP